jgi:thiamine-phosphate diphosphorylase
MKRDFAGETELYGRMLVALELLENCREFSTLIPEVRTNMVYAKQDAKTKDDVCAIEGRITVIGGMPRACGRPKLGASSHMARFILEMRKHDPRVRAGIDFANNPDFAAWLERYCRKKRWAFSAIDRSNEPPEIREAEGASMPWKVAEAVRAAGGIVPKIAYETGAVGKEPVSVILGNDPIEIALELCGIAKDYCNR